MPKAPCAERNTIQEVLEQTEQNLSEARQQKEAMQLANRSIHRFGGEESVWAAIGAGATVRGLCRMLEINPMTFYRWLDRGNDARRASFDQARRLQAQTLAEESLEIADSSDPTNVQVAKLRTDVRKWHASRLDPSAWGDQDKPAVSIDLGAITLEALRKRKVTIDPDDLIGN